MPAWGRARGTCHRVPSGDWPGRRLGYSENLFTPVEYDVTDAVLVGKPNLCNTDMQDIVPSWFWVKP